MTYVENSIKQVWYGVNPVIYSVTVTQSLCLLNYHLYHNTTYLHMIPDQLITDNNNMILCTTYMKSNQEI